MKVLIKDFEKMVDCIRSYNMYTCMIDSYWQEKEAEERNKELKTQFLETMRKYRADYPDFRFLVALRRFQYADNEDLGLNQNSSSDEKENAWNEFAGQIVKDELIGRYNKENDGRK